MVLKWIIACDAMEWRELTGCFVHGEEASGCMQHLDSCYQLLNKS
jgi:hypothetical protein